jgi:hypothetical protein
MQFKFDPKKHAKKPKGKSMTVPNQAYELRDLIPKFQAGGVVSSQLERIGEYHEHDTIPPEAKEGVIDLVDYDRISKDAAEKQSKIVAAQREKDKADKQAAADKKLNEAVEAEIKKRNEVKAKKNQASTEDTKNE